MATKGSLDKNLNFPHFDGDPNNWAIYKFLLSSFSVCKGWAAYMEHETREGVDEAQCRAEQCELRSMLNLHC